MTDIEVSVIARRPSPFLRSAMPTHLDAERHQCRRFAAAATSRCFEVLPWRKRKRSRQAQVAENELARARELHVSWRRLVCRPRITRTGASLASNSTTANRSTAVRLSIHRDAARVAMCSVDRGQRAGQTPQLRRGESPRNFSSAHERAKSTREAAGYDAARTAYIRIRMKKHRLRPTFRKPFPQQTPAKGARTPIEAHKEDSGCAGLAQRLHCGPEDGGRGRAPRATARPARPRLCIRHYRWPRG